MPEKIAKSLRETVQDQNEIIITSIATEITPSICDEPSGLSLEERDEQSQSNYIVASMKIAPSEANNETTNNSLQLKPPTIQLQSKPLSTIQPQLRSTMTQPRLKSSMLRF